MCRLWIYIYILYYILYNNIIFDIWHIICPAFLIFPHLFHIYSTVFYGNFQSPHGVEPTNPTGTWVKDFWSLNQLHGGVAVHWIHNISWDPPKKIDFVGYMWIDAAEVSLCIFLNGWKWIYDLDCRFAFTNLQSNLSFNTAPKYPSCFLALEQILGILRRQYWVTIHFIVQRVDSSHQLLFQSHHEQHDVLQNAGHRHLV